MKKFMKFTAAVTALVVAMSANVFAYAPSVYDGQSYESVGLKSDDPDGEINLAVIANGNVYIVGDSMQIDGSVYSNGDIHVGDGDGNTVNGLFISNTEGSVDEDPENALSRICSGYVHVNDDGTRDNVTYYSTTLTYEGGVKDENTSFECSYSDFVVPTIENNLGDVTMNVYNAPYTETTDWTDWQNPVTTKTANPTSGRTITEDTAFGKVDMNGSQNNSNNLEAALIIDTTEGDVTVVIDSFGEMTNPSILVKGDHQAYIYINNVSSFNNFSLNYNLNNYDENWLLVPEINGSTANTHLYLSGDDIVIGASYLAAADITVNANSLEISGSTKIHADITSGCENFTITGGTTEVYGTVCVPNADSKVVDSGILYGQLHTDTLTINGWGKILYAKDSAVTDVWAEESSTETTTEAPTPDDYSELYDDLGAKVIWYDIDNNSYELGRIKLVGHTPVNKKTATEEVDFSNLHYAVLDENTYWHTDEQLSDADWNEAVRRVTVIAEESQKSLTANNTQEKIGVFGRIDSNGYRTGLSVTPYAYTQIQADAGMNMYLCIADGEGHIKHALMIIDESIQYDEGLDGNANPYVKTFSSNGYKTLDDLLAADAGYDIG